MTRTPTTCSVCGVDYDPDFEGPCQEYASWATEGQIVEGHAPMCPGTVSLTATLERRVTTLEALIRRSAPFVNACVVVAEDKTNGLAWLADASTALGAADYDALAGQEG